MPVGRREITKEEQKFLEELQYEELMVNSPLWRARRDINLGVVQFNNTISMQQANTLRALVGKLLVTRFPVAAKKFAESEIGQFPYVRAVGNRG